MLSVRKPSGEFLRRYLTGRAGLDFSYSAVGATAHDPPDGFVLDHRRTKLGEGETVFRSARAALERWEQFHLGWVEAWPPETPIRPGEVVAVLGHAIGLWWLNSCRIAYVVDESGPISKFGFAYGTLPGHIASGEERFLIEWDRSDDSVWYDILAFSRPDQVLIRLGYPVVRRAQKRFGRDSAAAMLRAVRVGGCAARSPDVQKDKF
ncbi:DUF1990 domain-containing protein [Isosphaeraceae bacterium EP7]